MPKHWKFIRQNTLRLALYAVCSITAGCSETDLVELAGPEGAARREVKSFGLLALNIADPIDTLNVGDSFKVAVTGTYIDESIVDLTDDVNFSWQPETSAELISPGVLKFLSEGSLTLSASIDDVATQKNLSIAAARIESIHVDFDATKVWPGVALAITPYGIYSDERVRTPANISELSVSPSDFGFFTEDDGQFYFTANSVGEATLNWQIEELTLAKPIEGKNPEFDSLVIDPSTIRQPIGTAIPISLGLDTFPSLESLSSFASWVSDDPSIATVDSDGVIRLVGEGVTTVTANLFGQTVDVAVQTTASPVVSIAFSQDNIELPRGRQGSLTVVGTQADDNTVDLTSVVAFVSDSEAIVTVGNETEDKGEFELVNTGDTTIRASYAGLETSLAVRVLTQVPDEIEVVGSGDPVESIEIPEGTTFDVQMRTLFSHGQTTISTTAVTVTSQASSLLSATLENESGSNFWRLSGLQAGNTGLRVEHGDVVKVIPVTISGGRLTSIEITEATVELPKGRTHQFLLQGYYTDDPGNPRSIDADLATWYSSFDSETYDEPPVWVNNASSKGLALLIQEGIANVQAEFAGFTASSTVTVEPPVIDNLDITATSTDLIKGDDTSLTISAVFSDNSTRNVSELCSDHSLSITVNDLHGFLGDAITVDDQSCVDGTITIDASVEGVASIEASLAPDGGGDPFVNLEDEVVNVRSACVENSTTQRYGSHGDSDGFYCIYQGNKGASCTTTCTNAGLSNHQATISLLGSSAATGNECREAIELFDAFSAADFDGYSGDGNNVNGLGCSVFDFFGNLVPRRFETTVTDYSGTATDYFRLCACSTP